MSHSDIIGILRRNNRDFCVEITLSLRSLENLLVNFENELFFEFFFRLFVLRTLLVSLLVRCVGVGISMLGALNVFGF